MRESRGIPVDIGVLPEVIPRVDSVVSMLSDIEPCCSTCHLPKDPIDGSATIELDIPTIVAHPTYPQGVLS
jgi:hypothetical protein